MNLSEKNKIIIGCACALICEFLFGLSYLFTKQATTVYSAVTLLGWRFLIAFIMMNLCLLAKVIKINLKGKNLAPLFAIAIFQPIIYYISEALGISLTTTSESGSVIACIPITTLIASSLILKKKPTKMQIIGVCITLTGVLSCVLAKGFEASFNPFGYVMLFSAVVSYSLYSVFVEKAEEFTSLEKTYIMLTFGTIAFNAAALVEHMQAGTLMEYVTLPFRNLDFFIAIVYLGIGCSFLAFFLSNLAIAYLGTNRSASFVGISTVVSILVGIVILKESFSTIQIIGTILVIAGVYIANIILPEKCSHV